MLLFNLIIIYLVLIVHLEDSTIKFYSIIQRNFNKSGQGQCVMSHAV